MSGTNNGNSQTGHQSGGSDSYYTSAGQYSLDRWLGESNFDGPWNPASPRDYSHRFNSEKSKDHGTKGKGKGSRAGSKSKK